MRAFSLTLVYITTQNINERLCLLLLLLLWPLLLLLAIIVLEQSFIIRSIEYRFMEICTLLNWIRLIILMFNLILSVLNWLISFLVVAFISANKITFLLYQLFEYFILIDRCFLPKTLYFLHYSSHVLIL